MYSLISSWVGLLLEIIHKPPGMPGYKKNTIDCACLQSYIWPFSSPEPTILLACGRNRELWEQPFQACTIDADCVKLNGRNSIISFVISKWLLPELSFSDHWSRGTKTLGTRLTSDRFCLLLAIIKNRMLPRSGSPAINEFEMNEIQPKTPQ